MLNSTINVALESSIPKPRLTQVCQGQRIRFYNATNRKLRLTWEDAPSGHKSDIRPGAISIQTFSQLGAFIYHYGERATQTGIVRVE